MTVKPNPTFEYCSLHYLNQWLTYDKKYNDVLSGQDRKKKLDVLAEAANFYAIARTLPTASDTGKGLCRYEPVLNVLDGISEAQFRNNPVQAICDVASQISGAYGDRGVLSATTKFLWLKIKHPIVIYDSRVWSALKIKAQNDYFDAYYKKWREEFDLHKSQIKNVCTQLSGVHLYAIDQNDVLKEIQKVSSELWFHERVFDSYLWHKGSGG